MLDEPNYDGWDFDDWTEEDFEQLWEERAAIREMDGLIEVSQRLESSAQREQRRREAERAAYWELRKLTGKRRFSKRVMEAAKGKTDAPNTDDQT